MKAKEYYNDLADRSKEGDLSAIEQLFNELKPVVIGYIKKYCALPEEMRIDMFEDMVQDSYPIIANCAERYDKSINDSFVRFTLSEIRHHYQKMPRQYRRMDSLNTKADSDSDTELWDMLTDPRPGPEDEVILAYERTKLSKDKETLRAGLKELMPQEREVIDSIFYKNKSGTKTADIMGLSKQHVSNLKSRSLKKLKNFFLENSTKY